MEGVLAHSGLPAIGAEIAGKYRIEALIGQGGMGAVFSAQNTLTGKRVAIKWLLPEQAGETSRERLLREARIAASIEHPNVVDIYDIGEHDGGLFLVMEYLRGNTLDDLLAERGLVDPLELIGMLIPVMRGVHFAHQCGVVHRDLKPENIILSEVDGQIVPKVLDFGVSKAIGGGSMPHATLTRTGALIGTPHYMALEQVDGSGAVDGRTDVYAFGVIIYRALTGQHPFDGSSLGEVILKIGTKDPEPMRIGRPELNPGLDAAVLRAIARPRHERYQSVEEFARALEPFAPGVRFRESGETPHFLSVTAAQRYLGPVGHAPPTPFELSQQGLYPVASAPARASTRSHRRLVAAGATAGMLLVLIGLTLGRVVLKSPDAPVKIGASEVRRGNLAMPMAEAPTALPLAAQPDAATSNETAEIGTIESSPSALESSSLVSKPKAVPRSDSAKNFARKKRAQGPNVVPGDRTRGLSADDF